MDKLPKYLCELCIINLNSAYSFKEQCELTEKKFYNLIEMDSDIETYRPENYYSKIDVLNESTKEHLCDETLNAGNDVFLIKEEYLESNDTFAYMTHQTENVITILQQSEENCIKPQDNITEIIKEEPNIEIVDGLNMDIVVYTPNIDTMDISNKDGDLPSSINNGKFLRH